MWEWASPAAAVTLSAEIRGTIRCQEPCLRFTRVQPNGVALCGEKGQRLSPTRYPIPCLSLAGLAADVIAIGPVANWDYLLGPRQTERRDGEVEPITSARGDHRR